MSTHTPCLTLRDVQDALSALRGERERQSKLIAELARQEAVRGHNPEAIKAARGGAVREVERLAGAIARFEDVADALS